MLTFFATWRGKLSYPPTETSAIIRFILFYFQFEKKTALSYLLVLTRTLKKSKKDKNCALSLNMSLSKKGVLCKLLQFPCLKLSFAVEKLHVCPSTPFFYVYFHI